MLLIGTIKQLFTDYSVKSKYISPSTPTISICFALENNWCLIGKKCGMVMMASKYAYNVYSMARKGYVLLEDVDVCIVLDQYSQFHCRATSQNKLSTDRHVAPLGLRVNQSFLWLLNAVCSMKHRISIVYSLVWADRWRVYYNI